MRLLLQRWHIALAFAALVATTPTLSSQELRTVVDATFENGPDGFYVGNGDQTSMRVESGRYVFEKWTETGNWHTYRFIYLDPDRDYEIEAAIMQRSGVDNNSFNITWGGEALANAYSFGISTNGYYIINRWEDNEFREIAPWTEIPHVRAMGTLNTLKIRSVGGRWTFFVNDQEVHSMRAQEITGGLIGLTVNDRMTIACDRFTVRSDQPGIKLAENMPKGLKKERLPDGTNTPYTDKSPVISPDGSMLFISGDNHPGNTYSREYDDIYVARRKKDGSWGPLQNFGPPINNSGHNFLVSITADNNAMLIGNTYRPDGSADASGFSYTERTSNGWMIPKTIEIENYYNRNKHVEACLGPDGNTLLMTIQRDDSRGQKDIYVSFRSPDGTWTEPKNLGPQVSTRGNEVSPFLAADGVSLYFSTDGLPGYGSNDIFLARRLDDTWTNWSEPVNLGPEINTPDWDAYYTVPADGSFAYYCATGPRGDLDVFRVELPSVVKPKPVVIVSGTVYNKATNQPMAAKVRYERLSDGSEIGTAISDPSTGAYKVVLAAGEVFGVRADAAGFFPISDSVETTSLETYREITRDLFLEPMQIGRAIRLNNVFFDVGKAELRSESFADLDRLVSLLRDKPNAVIEISGHTDDVGKDSDNLDLSNRRAAAVRTYVIGKGIDEDRVSSKGFGETSPIASNKTDQGRQENRRVEFKLVKE